MMQDLDLDVYNLLKKAPQDDETGYLYIHGTVLNETDEIECNTVILSDVNVLGEMFLSTIKQHENVRVAVFNSVLSYLSENQKQIKDFEGHLNDIKE